MARRCFGVYQRWRRDLGVKWLFPQRMLSRIDGADAKVLAAAIVHLLVIAAFVVPPLVILTMTAISEWDGFQAVGLTAEHLAEAANGMMRGGVVRNSLVFAGGTSIGALALGGTLAWVVARTDAPFKKMIFVSMFVSFALPGIIQTIGWVLVIGPNAGILNVWLRSVGLDILTVNVFSMAGLIFVEALSWAPVAFLLMIIPFRSMDPSLEEAAFMSGAGQLHATRRITLALAWPSIAAVLILSFVRAIEAFEVPAILGIPAGIRVMTTEIYLQVQRGIIPNYGLASAYALWLIILVIVLLLFYTRMTRTARRFSTITGKGFRSKEIELRKWRVPLAAGALLVAIVIALPLVALVWASFMPYYIAPSIDGLEVATLQNYLNVVADPLLTRAVRNSMVIATVAGLVTTAITVVAAWFMTRTTIPGRRLLDFLISLPLVIPGVVAGVAVLRTHLTIPTGIYGTIWILVVGYVMRFMPFAMRYSHPGLLQIHPELEEAAEVSGSSRPWALVRIALPLMVPSLMGSFVFVFLTSLRELPMALLLSGAGSEVISLKIFELYTDGQLVELAAFSVLVSAFMIVVAMGLLRITGGEVVGRG